jgi:hypothetical protein
MRGMRRLSLLLGLCACGDPPRPVALAHYQPTIASESWCRIDPGLFGFVPHPQVAPPLLGYSCAAARRESPPSNPPAGSTFAELIIEPGGSIEIPVQLPQVLQGAGCQLDSVVIAHGKRSSDLAIEIASAGRMLPIVSYAQLPLPPGDGAASRTVVSDGSGRRKSIWAPDAPAAENTLAVTAEPDLWPTGALLRFDGGRRTDGAASIIFEIEREPEPEPSEESEGTDAAGAGTSGTAPPGGTPATGTSPSPQPFGPSLPPSPTGAPPTPSPVGPAPQPVGPAPSPIGPSPQPSPSPVGPAPQPWPAPPPSPAADPKSESGEQAPSEDDPLATPRQPTTLTLVAYRHRIDIAAPDSFSIVLRAREKAFGVGVRSGRESSDPRLSYRAPGAAEPVPTHLVPQVGIVVSRCGRPVEAILRDIHRR